jgi:hypothetical protein
MINDITSTFLVRVSGHSMDDAGISDGDELVVDRSLTPVDGNVVIAIVDGELTIKRLRLEHGCVRLPPKILIILTLSSRSSLNNRVGRGHPLPSPSLRPNW